MEIENQPSLKNVNLVLTLTGTYLYNPVIMRLNITHCIHCGIAHTFL